MVHGYAAKVFGKSYLLAVFMPSDGVPDYCEFKRTIGAHEQLLGKDGWESPMDTRPRPIRRDPNESSTYFTYYMDENAGDGAEYMFRVKMDGVLSPWRSLETVAKAVLPAPVNVRARVKHGHN